MAKNDAKALFQQLTSPKETVAKDPVARKAPGQEQTAVRKTATRVKEPEDLDAVMPDPETLAAATPKKRKRQDYTIDEDIPETMIKIANMIGLTASQLVNKILRSFINEHQATLEEYESFKSKLNI